MARSNKRSRFNKNKTRRRHIQRKKYIKNGGAEEGERDSAMSWLKPPVGDPAFRTQLDTLVSTMPEQGPLGSYLRAVCSSSGYCMSLGQKRQLINHFFDGFANMKYAFPPLKKIASGNNGFVLGVDYQRNTYKAICTLKCSLKKTSDNLFYEAYVGKTYINRLCEFFPLFLETFACYWIDNIDVYNELQEAMPFSSIASTQSLGELLNRNALQIIDPTDMSNLDKAACNDPKRVCVLTEFIENAYALGDVVKAYISKAAAEGPFLNHALPVILFQVYSVLAAIGPEYTHYDLHPGNCLIYTIPNNKYLTLIYHQKNGTTVELNTIFIAKLIDYGRCFVPTSSAFHSAVSATPACLTRGEAVAGSNNGFEWFEPSAQPAYYWISSKIFNWSHDLRLVSQLSSMVGNGFHIGRMMRRVTYNTKFGTPSVNPSFPNPDRKIRNTVEMANELTNFFNVDPGYKNANAKLFTSRTKIGDLHIYLDRSQPMNLILS